MVEIAKNKYKDRIDLKFETAYILKNPTSLDYDFVVIPDTIGHIENLEEFILHIAKILKPGTPLIISTANSLWEPILLLAEKLKMETPEGLHWWLSTKENEDIFKKIGLKITKKATACSSLKNDRIGLDK